MKSTFSYEKTTSLKARESNAAHLSSSSEEEKQNMEIQMSAKSDGLKEQSNRL